LTDLYAVIARLDPKSGRPDFGSKPGNDTGKVDLIEKCSKQKSACIRRDCG
jgi:hypothetical protein